MGDVDGAIATVLGTMEQALLVGDSYPRYTQAVLAQFYAELSREEEALDSVHRAMEYAYGEDSPYTQASTHELAANLNFEFGRITEAVGNMRDASDMYGQLEQYLDQGRALSQTGMLEIHAFESTIEPSFLAAAYGHLTQSVETYLLVGDGRNAAQILSGVAMIDGIMGNHTQALTNYGLCAELANAFNDPVTAAFIYQRMAEIYLDEQQISLAQEALRNARLWAEAFEIPRLIIEIDLLEGQLGNSI
jgi:tetratricopeptide (TPR) repeat protein